MRDTTPATAPGSNGNRVVPGYLYKRLINYPGMVLFNSNAGMVNDQDN